MVFVEATYWYSLKLWSRVCGSCIFCLPSNLFSDFVKWSSFATRWSNRNFVDNKSALPLSKSPLFSDRSKHISMKYHFVRDCIDKQYVELKFVMSQVRLLIFYKAIEYRWICEVSKFGRSYHKKFKRGCVSRG